MTTAADFQMLVDGFGALGALSVAAVLIRRPVRSPVQTVLMLVFGLAGVFYACRALAVATGIGGFGLASLALACTLPLGALILAEILLRRHAPLPLKIVIAGGAVLGLLAALLVGAGMEEAFSLAFYVPMALGLVLVLILFRDRKGLAPMENAILDSYARALLLTGVLVLTDFGLFGAVGLSALGMLGLAYAAAAGASGPRRWVDAVKELALAGATALLLGGALLRLRAPETLLEAGGVVGVTVSALLALSVLLRLRSGGSDQKRRTFDQALVDADVSDLKGFLAAASQAAPLQGLVLAEGGDLADYGPDRLLEAFGSDRVAALARLERDGTEATREGREQMIDLLNRHAATHAVLILERPLKIALVGLAGSALPEEDEQSLALFQKLAWLVAQRDAGDAA
jgi:hypothetical protein